MLKMNVLCMDVVLYGAEYPCITSINNLLTLKTELKYKYWKTKHQMHVILFVALEMSCAIEGSKKVGDCKGGYTIASEL